MLVDLVQVSAADGMRLHGALETPPQDQTVDAVAPLVDAWLCIHGTGSNFYSASTLAGLVPKLLAGGAAVLRANTRGHDLVSTGPTAVSRGLQGAAFERVDESPLDLAAWIGLLRERGYRSIGLLGHSMGAIKAIFTLSADDPPEVAALVAISPPHLSYSYYLETERAEEFRRTFALAQERITAGQGDELMLIRFPLTYYVSAAGFVDRYGPDEKYNVLRLLPKVAVPTLVTYGSSEMQEITFRGMSDAVEQLSGGKSARQVAVIAGADHIYSGVHDVLAARIERWLARQARGA